jgi:hypothetical protein
MKSRIKKNHNQYAWDSVFAFNQAVLKYRKERDDESKPSIEYNLNQKSCIENYDLEKSRIVEIYGIKDGEFLTIEY